VPPFHRIWPGLHELGRAGRVRPRPGRQFVPPNNLDPRRWAGSLRDTEQAYSRKSERGPPIASSSRVGTRGEDPLPHACRCSIAAR